MIKYIFIILLGVHLLGDFYFQTEKTAERKQSNFRWTLYHAVTYAVISSVLFWLVLPGMHWGYVFLFVISHGLIDIAKYVICKYICKSNKPYFPNKRNIFLIDQGAHFIIIVIIAYIMRDINIRDLYRINIQLLFDAFHVSELLVLSWGVKLLLIHKPANILIVNILGFYKPSVKNQPTADDKNAGRFIGTLERIIMTFFISINQYSAVGLVLTAKSIARYDKISSDQEFAEYYLLGTLLSTLIAIAVSVIFF